MVSPMRAVLVGCACKLGGHCGGKSIKGSTEDVAGNAETCVVLRSSVDLLLNDAFGFLDESDIDEALNN